MIMANLSLKREQGTLILRSQNSCRWFGLFFAAFPVFWLIGWVRPEPNVWVVLAGSIASAAIGGLMMLPWAITTVFDLRRRQVLIDVSSGYGFYRHSRDYAFADIAGIELWLDFQDTSMGCPVLKLRNGETRKLAISYVSRAESEGFMAEICAATGLPRIADGR